MIFESNVVIRELTPDRVAQRVAKDFISFVNFELESKDSIAIAFSGGGTPNLLFSNLASIKNRSKIPWQKLHIFQVDERWVPKNHADNNFKTLKHLLIDKIQIPEENLHAMPVTDDKEDNCRKNYELEIKLNLGNENPVFDLIFLGMGDDGHTASIFPGESGVLPLNSENFVEVPFVKKMNSLRMTLTAKVLLNSRNIWVLVTGKSKSVILDKVFKSSYNTELYPIQVISKSTGKILFYVDEEAALLLSKK